MSFIKQESRESRKIKWILIAHLTGTAGGLVGSAFHLSVSWAPPSAQPNPGCRICCLLQAW